MTESLYHLDSYMRVFQARITKVDYENHALILNQTAFYPGGGGQPNDFGILEIEDTKLQVIKVKKIGDDILHFLESNQPLPLTGAELTGHLDWERRYKLMRTHTALHILCGTIFRDYGAHVTGGDMDILEGRMDFEFDSLQKEFVQLVETAVNREVEADRPILVSVLPRKQAFQIPDLIRTRINLLPEGIKFVRTVEIKGLDLQADGGTHVASTREVGRIHIIDYKSKGKINKRIYIRLEEV